MQGNSIEATVDELATMAATLAHDGICPASGGSVEQRAMSPERARQAVALLASGGVSDLPTTSMRTTPLVARVGASGHMFVVLPGACGIALHSTKLAVASNALSVLEQLATSLPALKAHGRECVAAVRL